MHWWSVGVVAASVAVTGCGEKSSHGSSGGTASGASAGSSDAAGGANMSSGSGGLAGAGGGGGAGPSGSWVRHLPAERNGSAYALASDANDNVLALVATDVMTEGPSTLVKLDRNGGMVWGALISDYFADGLAARPNGDMVVIGGIKRMDEREQAAADVIVASYDPDGNERFRIVLEAGSNAAPGAFNLDPRGHIWLRWSRVPMDGTNSALSELDENGTLLSTVGIGGVGPFYSTAVDNQGNVLDFVGVDNGYAVRKHDSSGKQQWEKPVDIEPGGLAGDGAGNVLVVGTFGSTQNHVIKLDQDGKILFETSFGDTNELASLVVSDGFGRTFTASTTQDDATTVHVIARLFDDDGTLLRAYTVDTSPLEWPVTAAVDSKGALLVGGMTDGTPPGEVHSGASDAFIARVEP